jgi:thiol-disulfide isomerase/thioredoxin
MNPKVKKLSFSLLLACITSLTWGQTTVQPFELMNVADDKMVSVKACAGCVGTVVIFTSLKCPYDQHYQERIKNLYEKYAGKISFFLIDSNPGADEDDSKMKAAYANWNMSIPFLSDKSQVGLKTLNATRTPEAFLLKSEGNRLKVVYQGAIDDNPQVHHDTGKNFLDDAMTELVAGKPIRVSAERVIGCTIRKNP